MKFHIKNNKCGTGDGFIFRDDKVIIHNLGALDWEIYGCISDNHISDEVIITEGQLRHIRDNHPEAYQDTVHYVRDILDDPDYILRDRRPNTGLVIKRVHCEKESLLLVLRICTSADRKEFKNSIITSWKITEKRLNNYLRNKDIIYSKE